VYDSSNILKAPLQKYPGGGAGEEPVESAERDRHHAPTGPPDDRAAERGLRGEDDKNICLVIWQKQYALLSDSIVVV
jgi:hypothetical protein